VGETVLVSTNWTEQTLTSSNMSAVLYVNGAAVGTVNSSGSWANFTYTLSSSDYPQAVFSVRATDVYGNTGYSANMSVSVNLSCGAQITSNLTLESNLNCSSSALFMAADDITLNCNGYALTGGLAAGSKGIIINSRHGITIQNCNISGFETAIYANNSNSSRFTNLTVRSNSYYGVYLLGSGNGNTISQSTIENHGRAGILITGSAQGNNISGNYLYNNTRSIEINSSESNNIFNNNISSSSVLGIDIATGSVYWEVSSRNRIVDNNLTVRGTINITGSGVLELINSYLTLNGVLFGRTGNITTLESESRNMTANTTGDVSFNEVDVNLTLMLSENVSAVFVASPVVPNSTPSSLNTLKAVDISVPSSVNGNLTWAIIRIFYNASELASANIDESTLKMYYYNESSSSWQLEPHQGVDTANNYVWANVTHFSTYGAFGSAPASSSSSGGGGSSSGSYTSTVALSDTPTEIRLMQGEGVRINLEGIHYTMMLNSFNKTSASFIITSYYTNAKLFSLYEGEGINVNLTGDAYNDLEVVVKEIANGRVTVSLRRVNTTLGYGEANKSAKPAATTQEGGSVTGEAVSEKPVKQEETPASKGKEEARENAAENPASSASPGSEAGKEEQERTGEKNKAAPAVKNAGRSKGPVILFIGLAAVALLIALIAFFVERRRARFP